MSASPGDTWSMVAVVTIDIFGQKHIFSASHSSWEVLCLCILQHNCGFMVRGSGSYDPAPTISLMLKKRGCLKPKLLPLYRSLRMRSIIGLGP